MRVGMEGPIPRSLFLTLDARAPVPNIIALVVFISILILLRGGGVGMGESPIPQLSHDFVQRLASRGARIYKTGKEQTLVNHC